MVKEHTVKEMKLLEDLGYDLGMFGQKQIDSMVQSIKRQAQSGYGFSQGGKPQQADRKIIEPFPKTARKGWKGYGMR